MVVDSILPHAESGPNDYRKDAPRFKILPDEDVRSSAVIFLTFLTRTSSPQLAIVHGNHYICYNCKMLVTTEIFGQEIS